MAADVVAAVAVAIAVAAAYADLLWLLFPNTAIDPQTQSTPSPARQIVLLTAVQKERPLPPSRELHRGMALQTAL